MLSHKAEYALKAALYIANLGASGRVSAAELARELELPQNYLSKILNEMSSKGILKSYRGRGGGFSLARRPAETPVGEVIGWFDHHGETRPHCLLRSGECSDINPCPAHKRWVVVHDEVNSFFKTATLADLVEGGAHSATLR